MPKQKIVFDLEADSLLDSATKIHCLSYLVIGEGNKVVTLFNYDEMIKFFSQPNVTFIGHNVASYDFMVVKKILGLDFKSINFEDTLYLSQYIFPNRYSYSLESFGPDYGLEKVQISDWSNLSKDDYKLRCETDVVINTQLYNHILNKLLFLYDNDEGSVNKLITYLSLKSFFCGLQVINRVHIDRGGIVDLIAKLGVEREEKVSMLKMVMPSVPKFTIRQRPKVMNKADGSLSKIGEAFVEICRHNGVDYETVDEVKYISGYSEPNPSSTQQVKDWLFSLGWKPATIKFNRDKVTNALSTVPQIYKEDKTLCDSVLLLADKEPAVHYLSGLGILSHRIEQLEGLLKYSSPEGLICQEMPAITPTFRYRHGKVVNLPGVDKAYGKDFRSLFKAPKGYVVVGCDIKALEDQCKLHYIAPIDPDYVKEISKPGYDPHLALAVAAGFLTEEQALQHKNGEANFSKERKLGKVCNFSSQYSVGKTTLARNTGLSEYQAGKLLDAYWQKNWSIKKFSSERERKDIMDNSQIEKWVRSPLTGFWMFLRNEKDIFSVVTQSAGVWVFDNFVAEVVSAGISIPLQSHDEIMFYCREGEEEGIKNILKKCIENVNKRLSLNVVIDIDIKFGSNYAEVH